MKTQTLMAAPRDASFHAHPSTNGGAWHVVTEGDAPACSKRTQFREARMMLQTDRAEPAADVPDYLRCHRPGCKQRWPASSP